MDILSLCTDISKLLLGIVSQRRSGSLLYLCLSCVFGTTHGNSPQARTQFPWLLSYSLLFPCFPGWWPPCLPTSYHVKYCSSATKAVHTNRKEPQNWGALGVADCLKKKLFPMCYHIKFGSSASKGLCVNRRQHQNWGALELCPHVVGTWLEYAPPHVLSCLIWSFQADDTNVIKETCLKNSTPGVSPFKLTQGQQNWHGSICHLWFILLTFHSKHGPSVSAKVTRLFVDMPIRG